MPTVYVTVQKTKHFSVLPGMLPCNCVTFLKTVTLLYAYYSAMLQIVNYEILFTFFNPVACALLFGYASDTVLH